MISLFKHCMNIGINDICYVHILLVDFTIVNNNW